MVQNALKKFQKILKIPKKNLIAGKIKKTEKKPSTFLGNFGIKLQ